MVVQIPEFLMRLLAEFAWLRIDSVVPDAVVEDEDDVFEERLNVQIVMVFQFLCYRSEVHWFLNY